MGFMMYYYEGHPAGWTDDLGIIADRNQYIDAEDSGWYCIVISPNRTKEIRHWCENTIQNYWNYSNRGFFFAEEQDALLFTLRWGDV